LPVQVAAKPPPPTGADDAEVLEPDAIGADWLSRATQSERSASEADLEADLDNIAAVDAPPEPGDEEA
jgi:hypothetical protein